ncbi:neuropeptides B/W receptor type 1-like [Paramacrobiotus metropolitanus]|uniref:neuropeptides B/W receptor type 1-like n=1 Tax=Paramacrobiotus metropolitanus TaxID=2943436 RepID=UPI0024464F11|nr:neuropeptides B/W receptor type 1-like [Paramacrobiotus metropolitanus]
MSNSSNVTELQWNGTATSQAVFSAVTLIINAYVLYLLIRHDNLRTPFNLYLINLLSANIFLTLPDPFRVMNAVELRWSFTSLACNVVIYSDWVGSAGVLHAHLLITLNRVWASTFPISYRNYHTFKMAGLLCILMWGYSHLLPGPLLVIDYFYNRPNMENTTECSVVSDQQPGYAKFLEIWVYDAPVFLIFLSYPFLYWKRRQRAKVCVGQGQGSTTLHAASNTEEGGGKRKVKDGRHGFWVLTALTLSIFLCWTPTKINGILTAFFDKDLPELKEIGDVLYSLQGILDPLLFAITMRDLREAILRSVGLDKAPCCGKSLARKGTGKY